MKNIAILCDSSVAFTKEEIKKYDIYTVPNIIMHNNKIFLDQITINNKEVNALLEKKETVTTSQANIGTMVETFKEIKEKGYDYLFVLSLASSLSGAYNGFVQAAKLAEVENYMVLDSLSIAGPVQQAVRAIRQMNKKGSSIREIERFLKYLFQNQVSYLFPQSLHQIVASGRVSKGTSTIASLLKIKPVVYLDKGGKSIEKLGIARTDKRAFDLILKNFDKFKVQPTTHDLYILESEALPKVEAFLEYISKNLGEFEYHLVNLPAALSVHVGVGAIAVQWCPKLPK